MEYMDSPFFAIYTFIIMEKSKGIVMNQKEASIACGVAGFGLGMFITSLVLGKEIDKLEKKNKTAFLLHKQMIEDTRTDLDDHALTSGEIIKRLADRLNFITISKSM